MNWEIRRSINDYYIFRPTNRHGVYEYLYPDGEISTFASFELCFETRQEAENFLNSYLERI